MRISILTFYKVLNYGAVLQAYALRKALQDMGHEVDFIPYQPSCLMRPYRSVRLVSLRKYTYIFRLIRNQFLWKPFKAFQENYLPDSSWYTPGASGLKVDPPVDAVVVGSDQVWNSRLIGDGRQFFLPFPGVTCRKIAYAASSGGEVDFLDDRSIIENFRTFHAVSVREASLAKAMEAKGLDCKVVLDPTMLLEDYSELLGNRINGDYVFLYHVVDSKRFNQGVKVARNTIRCPVINFGPKFLAETDRNLLGVSPEDWVEGIRNAKAVYTSSFHGLVFSLMFGKRFVYIPNGNASDSRCLDLLDRIDVRDRAANSKDDVAKILELPPVDARKTIQKLREGSLEFIRNWLD